MAQSKIDVLGRVASGKLLLETGGEDVEVNSPMGDWEFSGDAVREWEHGGGRMEIRESHVRGYGVANAYVGGWMVQEDAGGLCVGIRLGGENFLVCGGALKRRADSRRGILNAPAKPFGPNRQPSRTIAVRENVNDPYYQRGQLLT